MNYSQLCETYEDLEQNPSRLKKTEILSEFLAELKHLKQSDLAITLLNQMLPNGKIDANTAAWLINHVLEFKKPGDLSIEATGLLNDHHDKTVRLNLKFHSHIPLIGHGRENAASKPYSR